MFSYFLKILLFVSIAISFSSQAKEDSAMQTIKVVLPYQVGTGPDKVFRAVELYGKKKNIQFVPVYKLGADGIIGAEYTLSQPADGNTLLLTIISDIARPHPAKKFTVSDFSPISAVCNTSLYIVAHPSVAANNITELLEQVKKDPYKLSWGITSKNFETNLKWFAKQAGRDISEMLFTRFNAGVDISTNNIAGGFVDLAFYPASQIMPFLESKKVKLLGTFRKTDVVPYPVESFESVFGSLGTLDGYGLFMSSKTNPSVQKYWIEFMNDLKKDPDVLAYFKSNYFTAYPDGREALEHILDFNLKRSKTKVSGLTDRQEDILYLIKERGLSNRQISEQLKISESTVKLHVSNLMKKYQVRSRTQLAAIA